MLYVIYIYSVLSIKYINECKLLIYQYKTKKIYRKKYIKISEAGDLGFISSRLTDCLPFL